MAKENDVLLHGQIRSLPKAFASRDTGNFKRCSFKMLTLRRPMSSSGVYANKLFYEEPVIFTENPEIIKKIVTEKITQNDMVDIKGVVCTKETAKSMICPECGKEFMYDGVITYVNPIYICRRESDVPREKAIELLKERAEISNNVMVIGNLCCDPYHYKTADGIDFAEYQLAVSRRYRIKEDDTNVKTDFPWVKTYGIQAFEDSLGLYTGSMVYINGALQTREFVMTRTCPHCGTSITFESNATEIVPYSIEYLANCIFPEKKEEVPTGE